MANVRCTKIERETKCSCRQGAYSGQTHSLPFLTVSKSPLSLRSWCGFIARSMPFLQYVHFWATVSRSTISGESLGTSIRGSSCIIFNLVEVSVSFSRKRLWLLKWVRAMWQISAQNPSPSPLSTFSGALDFGTCVGGVPLTPTSSTLLRRQ